MDDLHAEKSLVKASDINSGAKFVDVDTVSVFASAAVIMLEVLHASIVTLEVCFVGIFSLADGDEFHGTSKGLLATGLTVTSTDEVK